MVTACTTKSAFSPTIAGHRGHTTNSRALLVRLVLGGSPAVLSDATFPYSHLNGPRRPTYAPHLPTHCFLAFQITLSGFPLHAIAVNLMCVFRLNGSSIYYHRCSTALHHCTTAHLQHPFALRDLRTMASLLHCRITPLRHCTNAPLHLYNIRAAIA